jgi:tRNA(Ile)-lysidine synthase
MLSRFKNYISEHQLFDEHDLILLAVSGGIDSMVMAELFHRAGYNFSIAHCNFGLRGAESNQDEKFVASMCEAYGVKLFVKNFKTREYAGFNKVSVQMAARTLRYEWFDELLESEGFKVIATAHHLDDQIETLFINILRGTGISGLHGILPNRKKIVHPMMFAYRRNIEEFSSDEAIGFREDSSNRSTKYVRNKLRHDLMPILSEINPDFRKTITSTIERIRESEMLLDHYFETIRQLVEKREEGLTSIDISQLLKFKPCEAYLYELLQPFDFSRNVTADITAGLNEMSGKQYFSPTHRLIKDREVLLITPLGPAGAQPADEVLIEEGTTELRTPLQLKFSIISNHPDLKINKSGSVAMLDAGKITWPLRLRKWKEGDSFVPYGMSNNKKLSDFFIDNKFSIVEKENAWLLISGNEIIWLIGHRIGNAYRITDKTASILHIEVME